MRNQIKPFSFINKLSLTSETSKGLMNHPNYRFTIHSHTDHRCDILHQFFCSEEQKIKNKIKTFRIKS